MEDLDPGGYKVTSNDKIQLDTRPVVAMIAMMDGNERGQSLSETGLFILTSVQFISSMNSMTSVTVHRWRQDCWHAGQS